MALGSRRRAERFAALLDDAATPATELAAGTAGSAGTADADADLGALVSRLQALPAPPGGMPADARSRLMAAAARELPAQAAARTADRPAVPQQRPTRPAPRRAAQRVRVTERFSLPAWTPLATGAVAAVIAVTGIGIAVSHALPDSWLHGSGGTTSTVQLNGAQTNAAIDQLNASQAELNRLATAAYDDAVAHQGRLSTEGAARTEAGLRSWAATSATRTARLLTAAKAGDSAARQPLLSYTAKEVRTLHSMLPSLPASLQQQVQRQITALQGTRAALGATPAPLS